MDIKDKLGHGVRQRRLDLGLSQQELADNAGISVRALRDIERGRVTSPRARAMTGIRRALGGTGSGVPAASSPATTGPGIHIGLLGPLLVRRDDALVSITSTMLRRLLAVLALQPQVTVSRDEVIDALWQGHPPAAYRSALHSYLGRLRATLGGRDVGHRLLRSSRVGLMLTADPDQLDVAAFMSLMRRASSVRGDRGATELLAEALAAGAGTLRSTGRAGLLASSGDGAAAPTC